MSKRRLVILSVVLEGRSQAVVAHEFSLSEATVSRWVSRYRTEGEAAFEPRSRRPNTSPARAPDEVITLIVELRRTLSSNGLDAGPATIGWHLEHHHQTVVSISTIRRHLIAAGLVTPNPRKRPKSSLTRFAADLPNECWQTDMTHVVAVRKHPGSGRNTMNVGIIGLGVMGSAVAGHLFEGWHTV